MTKHSWNKEPEEDGFYWFRTASGNTPTLVTILDQKVYLMYNKFYSNRIYIGIVGKTMRFDGEFTKAIPPEE